MLRCADWPDHKTVNTAMPVDRNTNTVYVFESRYWTFEAVLLK